MVEEAGSKTEEDEGTDCSTEGLCDVEVEQGMALDQPLRDAYHLQAELKGACLMGAQW